MISSIKQSQVTSKNRNSRISLRRVMSVRSQTELSGVDNSKVRRGCSPSLRPLRKSVAKVSKHLPSNGTLRVPVIAPNGEPLMPCTPRRARMLMEANKATPFWSRGIFCIWLVNEPSSRNLQPVAVGVDPGFKKEGISVISKHTDFLHVQLDARTQVKAKIKNRRELRRSRRDRKTPCRKPRWNRASLKKKRIPPSTKARWDWKLRNIKWLTEIYPISKIVVEDIKAVSKKCQRKWNQSFSPLEVGKEWFYSEVEKIAPLLTLLGWKTKQLRDWYGLKKTSSKLSDKFEAHCVDSWALAAYALRLKRKPNLKKLLCVIPLNFRRRSLHLQTPKKGGKRRVHGGTRSVGLRKGTIVQSTEDKFLYVGGTSNRGISLCDLNTGRRITQCGKIKKIYGYNSVRWHWAHL